MRLGVFYFIYYTYDQRRNNYKRIYDQTPKGVYDWASFANRTFNIESNKAKFFGFVA